MNDGEKKVKNLTINNLYKTLLKKSEFALEERKCY